MSWIILLYAMTLYVALNPICPDKTRILFFGLYGIVFIISLLSRHNAILQVWPVTLFWILNWLSKKDFSFGKYLWHFCIYSFLSGVLCVGLLLGLNSLMTRADNGNVYPATQIIIHQIVASCAPELDESCFKSEWWSAAWSENKNRMEDLKKRYEKNQLNSETFLLPSYGWRPFRTYTDLKGRYFKWLYAITKYPGNYLQHLKRYYQAFWFPKQKIEPQGALLREYSKESMIYTACIWNPVSEREEKFRREMAEKVPQDELGIRWNEKQIQTDKFIRKYYPSIDIFWFVCMNFISFIIACIFFFKRKEDVLGFMLFSSSLAGVISCIIIPAFSPIILIRYMNPVVFCGVLSLIFLILMLSKKTFYETKDWLIRKINR